MIKIGIIPNLGKEECRQVFISFCSLLKGKADLFTTDGVFSLPDAMEGQNHAELEELSALCGAQVTDTDVFFKNVDVTVVMGGDGSLLRAAPGAAKHGKPLIGINLGRVGYLASAEKSSLTEVAEKLLSGNYETCEHLMLSTPINNGQVLALNDIVISRSEMGRILEFSLFVDDQYVDTYTADGMVIATPTGSTAYSLSAGGPVAYPYMDMLILTPVCAHGLSSRPIVVPADKKITVRLGDKYDYKALVSADGHIIDTLTTGGGITVSRADKKVKLIKTNNYGFYDLLRIKLKGNR